MKHAFALTALALGLAACQPGGGEGTGIVTADDAETFSAIGPDETIRLTGTEPFWGGEVAGGTLRYSTPDDIDGTMITVTRFAGNNGLGYSGMLEGAQLDLAITPGDCSDQMSDRTYPFHATLKLGEETRNGCAWTEAMPFTGPEVP